MPRSTPKARKPITSTRPSLPAVPFGFLNSLTVLAQISTPRGIAEVPVYLEPGPCGGYRVCLDHAEGEWMDPCWTFENALDAFFRHTLGLAIYTGALRSPKTH